MTFIHRAGSALVSIALFGTLVMGVSSAGAQTFGDTLKGGLSQAAPQELKGTADPEIIIGRIISSAIGVLGAVLLVYLLYGGFIYMTAGGDSKKVQDATAIIKNAIIGLVIIALAYGIATFVIDELSRATGVGGDSQSTQTPGN